MGREEASAPRTLVLGSGLRPRLCEFKFWFHHVGSKCLWVRHSALHTTMFSVMRVIIIHVIRNCWEGLDGAWVAHGKHSEEILELALDVTLPRSRRPRNQNLIFRIIWIIIMGCITGGLYVPAERRPTNMGTEALGLISTVALGTVRPNVAPRAERCWCPKGLSWGYFSP